MNTAASRTAALRNAEGFLPLPRALCDALLCDQDALGLGIRELLLLLLIARLTHGCRGNAWATLTPGELRVIGIGRGHAREHLRRLLNSGLIESNDAQEAYRICPLPLPQGAQDQQRRQRLDALVRTHLAVGNRSRNRTDITLSKRPSRMPALSSPRYTDPDASNVGTGRNWRWMGKEEGWKCDDKDRRLRARPQNDATV